jgi:methionyl-tRNA synthetase
MTEENNLENKYINIDDFAKIQLKVGKILKWETIEGADKLYKFTVDVGETEKTKTESINEAGETIVTEVENKKLRTICSGIREFFPDGNIFINKYVCVVANLAPRKMRGTVSEGMLLFAGGDSGKLFFVTPEGEPKVGTIIR